MNSVVVKSGANGAAVVYHPRKALDSMHSQQQLKYSLIKDIGCVNGQGDDAVLVTQRAQLRLAHQI